jgi:hypothetical protein
VALAQTAWSGPVSGFVFDQPSASIRPIVGIIGSAYLGAPTVTGADLAAVSPDGKLAIRSSSDGVFLQRLSTGDTIAVGGSGVLSGADSILWSGDARTAILYSSAQARFQTIAVTDSAATAAPVQDASAVTGPITAFAVDPGGNRLAIGTGSALYLADLGSGSISSAAAMNAAALAFSDDGASLYAAGKGNGAILRMNITGDGVSGPDVLFGDTVPDDVGGIYQTGGKLYVAGRDRRFQIYDLNAGALSTEVPLEFTPASIESAGAKLLRFRTAPAANSSTALYVLDLNRPTPEILFVPAPEVE